MEVPVAEEEKKPVKIEEFTVASITELSASSLAPASSSTVIGRFRLNNEVAELRFDRESEPNLVSKFDLHNTQASFRFFFLRICICGIAIYISYNLEVLAEKRRNFWEF